MERNIYQLFDDIFAHVSNDWQHIKLNESIMKILDIETNCMCIKLIKSDQYISVETIQQRVLSFLLTIMNSMSDNNENMPSHISAETQSLHPSAFLFSECINEINS